MVADTVREAEREGQMLLITQCELMSADQYVNDCLLQTYSNGRSVNLGSAVSVVCMIVWPC